MYIHIAYVLYHIHTCMYLYMYLAYHISSSTCCVLFVTQCILHTIYDVRCSIYTYTYMHMHTYFHGYICYKDLWIRMHVYTHMHRLYANIYIYTIYTKIRQKGTERERERDREQGRKTQRKKEGEGERRVMKR